jgi:hypothetical protein
MIVTLREDAHGTLWIGTRDGGVSRLIDGRVHSYTTREGLFDNTVHTTIMDGYVSKPIEPAVLFAELARAARREPIPGMP